MEVFFSFDYQPISKDLRAKVFARDKGACVYCGKFADTIDHVVPIDRGGHNVKENLVAACRKCNSSKGDKLLTEWKPGDWELCPDSCTDHVHLGESRE